MNQTDEQLDRLVTETLAAEAARIEPGDRLDRIRDETGRSQRRRVSTVAGVAAAVVVVAAGAWAAVTLPSDGPHRDQPIATAPTPAASAVPSITSSAGSSYSPPAPSDPTFTVPVYFLGRDVPGLFREFLPGVASIGATTRQLLVRALTQAVDPAAPARPENYSPWLPGTSGAVHITLTGRSQVVVDLPMTETQADGRTPDQARLAAQQLAWTATATAQNAGLGVRLLFDGRPGKLFGSLSTSQVFHRPPMALAFEDLSAIWVESPELGQVVHRRVTVSGEACTFEANVAWELVGGGPTSRGPILRSGHTTATSGCPERGTWRVTLSGLSPGTYTFRASEPSEQGNGKLAGLDTTTFVVR
jgi:hypothetical protein